MGMGRERGTGGALEVSLKKAKRSGQEGALSLWREEVT